MTADKSQFEQWLEQWMHAANYSGRDVPHVQSRIDTLLQLWTSAIPEGWERGPDRAVTNPSVRYRRGNLTTAKPGTEHELELQILGPDPEPEPTTCFGDRLVDGINAIPLAKDPSGGRAGNVEADMLLLTESSAHHQQYLVEAKTTSNSCWYAVVENLRQLRLFNASTSAKQIMARRRNSNELTATAVSGLVLAPESFYSAAGARQRSVEPARALISALQNAGVHVQLGVWQHHRRAVEPLQP